MTIALATCAELPTGHLEDELAERLGATWAIWDDPAVVAWLQERLGPLTYARVDLLAGPDGAPVVLELELTEPCLFLPYVHGAAERFATAFRAAG